MDARSLLLLAVALTLPSCTAFSAVRSAEVAPGYTIDAGMTWATPAGDAAAWFWAFDCPSQCDRPVPAIDVSFTRGVVPEGSARPFEIGGGLSGFYPYAQAYVQLRRGSRPFGLGGRLAAGPESWFESSLFLRHDVPFGPRIRLLVVPTLFAHWGNSPNGANPGHLLAVAQGLGLETRMPGISVTPSALLVAGRVERRSYRERIRADALFAVFGLNLRFGT